METVVVKASGLYLTQNQLSAVPEGALSAAVNCVIDKDSVIESRRGLQNVTAIGSVAAKVDVVSSYGSLKIAHRSDDNTLLSFNGTTWTAFAGTYNHVDSTLARIRFVQQNGNLYFTTADGVKITDGSGSVYSTGIPTGLDGSGVLTGASGFLTADKQVAYRVVFGSRDANSNLYLGAPSERIIVINSTGSSADVSLTFTVPDGLAAGDFFQVYRSSLSVDVVTEPSDELQLVYEDILTSGHISAKSVTFTDLLIDSLKGAFLYTNATQEGLQEGNEEPPLASDIAVFKNYMFYSGIKTRHGVGITIFAVGGSQGVTIGDTINLGSLVFTAAAAENTTTRSFQVFSTGSAGIDIGSTAKSLVKIINQSPSNTLYYAYYLSGYKDIPGRLFIEKRSLTGGSFTVTVSRATSWQIDNQGVSSNNDSPHGIMWSKASLPEAVPFSHLEFVGNKNFPIRRIIGLQDALFILKDDGIWRLTGDAGLWSIQPLDTSTHILAPESAVVLNNQIYCFTNQGIVTVSGVGVAVISRPIEENLTELIGLNLTKLKTLSFGIGYETDRKYMLWTISDVADTAPTQAFVFNVFTRSWTTFEKSVTCGFVDPIEDKIYFGTNSPSLLVERKSFNYTDYADEEITGFSVSSYSGSSVVLNTVVGLNPGDLLTQSTTIYSPIVSIDSSTNTVVINDEKSWTIGSVTALKSIFCQIEWVNQTGGNPGVEKLFQEVAILFRENQFTTATVGFFTDLLGGYLNSTIFGSYGGNLWGGFSWGSVPWGGLIRPKPIRVFVPRDKSRGSLLSIRFTHQVGYGKFSLNGFTLQYEVVSERMNKA